MVRRAFFAFVMLLVIPVSAQAYTFNGNPQNAIGGPIFSTYGMDVSHNQGTVFDIYTNYPQAGPFDPADFFITMNSAFWAVPLINHDGFDAGSVYRVGTYRTSDTFSSSGIPGVPVWLTTMGAMDPSHFTGGDVYWYSAGGSPDWRIHVDLPISLGDNWSFIWGTATCANGLFEGSTPPSNVPVPPPSFLLGSGLVGLYIVFKKRRL